jgi:hypothetical protein
MSVQPPNTTLTRGATRFRLLRPGSLTFIRRPAILGKDEPKLSRDKSLSAILSLTYEVFIFACSCLNVEAQSRREVVLTTDVGAEMDDQWTLAHLALAPEIELHAGHYARAESRCAGAAGDSARYAAGRLSDF